MSFTIENRAGTIKGIIFVAAVAVFAGWVSTLGPVRSLGLSPLVIGIIIGIIYANTIHDKFPRAWDRGISFSGKKILRFAIVFYGFRITFQQIADVGMDGFLVSLIMLSTTFLLGIWLGWKVFKMDRDTSILNASGASVCGAAAVLATEPVLKSDEYKAVIAVSMVVLFGTIAMFLYPLLHSAGVFNMSDREFGIYAGATIHEVAQVVAVGGAFGPEAGDTAVIVKMTRVIMLAPLLLLLGLYLSFRGKNSGRDSGPVKLVIPWFAVYFIGMAGVNSLIQERVAANPSGVIEMVLPGLVALINQIDTFLLSMSMVAIGMGTRFSKFKGHGMAPLYTAGLLFLWLLVGGYFVTKLVVF